MRISPFVGVVIPARIFRIVVLPAPLWPTIPSASPSFTRKVTSRRAHIGRDGLRNTRAYQRLGASALARILYFLETLSSSRSIISDHVRHCRFRRFEKRIANRQTYGNHRRTERENSEVRCRASDYHTTEAFDQTRNRIEQIQTPPSLGHSVQAVNHRNSKHPDLQDKRHGKSYVSKPNL